MKLEDDGTFDKLTQTEQIERLRSALKDVFEMFVESSENAEKNLYAIAEASNNQADIMIALQSEVARHTLAIQTMQKVVLQSQGVEVPELKEEDYA